MLEISLSGDILTGLMGVLLFGTLDRLTEEGRRQGSGAVMGDSE